MPEENNNMPSHDVADSERSGDRRLSTCSASSEITGWVFAASILACCYGLQYVCWMEIDRGLHEKYLTIVDLLVLLVTCMCPTIQILALIILMIQNSRQNVERTHGARKEGL